MEQKYTLAPYLELPPLVRKMVEAAQLERKHLEGGTLDGAHLRQLYALRSTLSDPGRRRYHRLPVDLQALLRYSSSSHSSGARVKDISAGGMRLDASIDAQVGERLDVTIGHGTSLQATIPCCVRRVDRAGEHAALGLSFDGAPVQLHDAPSASGQPEFVLVI